MSPHQSNHYSPRVILLTQLFYPEMVSTGQTMTELAEELVQIKSELIFSRTKFEIGLGSWKNTSILKDKVKIKTNLFLFKE